MTQPRRTRSADIALTLALAALPACGTPSGGGPDANAPEGGGPDAGGADGPAHDAVSVPDAGDAGTGVDAGDAGSPSDAGPPDLSILPADRATAWVPGMMAMGGIPQRTTVCATVRASDYGNGAQEASGAIQAAIDACPPGQVVQLTAGTFTLDQSYVGITRGITLRGAGAGQTILQKTNGATPGSYTPPDAQPLVIVGPNRWPRPDDATAQDLTADGAKGSASVTVADASGIHAGDFVLLDELTGAQWVDLPPTAAGPNAYQIRAGDRAVWQMHNPPKDGIDDPLPDALGWFCRPDRPINEIKEVASVQGNTVTFTTPLHISYRTSHGAQLTRYADAHVTLAGVEDMTLKGGSDGALRFEAAAYSWAARVEDTVWLGEGVAIDNSFRIEVRDSYVHDGAWPEPGGGGYAVSLASGSAEALIENNIVMQANKMMVARASGAGSVVAYNYADDGHIMSVPDWQEVGINGSHMVGSHHMLFEGNDSFNYDSDFTHGNAIYQTVFRNRLSGLRRDYAGLANARAAGLEYGSWWHSFVGNVLGFPGMSAQGWAYEDPGMTVPASPGDNSYAWGDGQYVWKLGYDSAEWFAPEVQYADPQVLRTTIRHGNFDYVTNAVHWDPTIASQSLPASLYLHGRPAFFDAGRGYAWPWVDPMSSTPVGTLPARARYDAGTPFAQP